MSEKLVNDGEIAKDYGASGRGLLMVNTGEGKGKSTAAFGALARALGDGLRCAMVQFVKGWDGTGEARFFSGHPLCSWRVLGSGFVWDSSAADGARAAALEAWGAAKEALADPAMGLVILDEFTYVLEFGWIAKDEALAAFRGRPRHQHLIVTGRGAPAWLVDEADTVTEMRKLKHAYDSGVQGARGVEW
jgi:cob(I)alamin adenosyltransferase